MFSFISHDVFVILAFSWELFMKQVFDGEIFSFSRSFLFASFSCKLIDFHVAFIHKMFWKVEGGGRGQAEEKRSRRISCCYIYFCITLFQFIPNLYTDLQQENFITISSSNLPSIFMLTSHFIHISNIFSWDYISSQAEGRRAEEAGGGNKWKGRNEVLFHIIVLFILFSF